MLTLCVGIFAGVFSLYSLPYEAVLYSGILCVLLILVFGIFDFWNFYKRYKALLKVQEEFTISINHLPEGTNLIEESYIKLIKSLFKQQNKLISKSADEMSEMIDYYTLWVHQIKTPIAAMDLLLQGHDSNESKELKTQLFKIEQYVDMVLVYLRMNSESSDYVLKEFSLDSVVKQCIRKYASIFIRKKISIDLKPITAKVITDEKWLSFVIEQILSNAIKYTKEGAVSIYMENPNELVISDTGIGIAAEDLQRIFERGFTGYNGRMDKKASGIGMYLSKQILNKLGHEITVESNLGTGTKVSIYFNSKTTLFD